MEKLLSQRFWIQPAPLLRIIPKVALLITSQSHLEFLDFWLRTSVAIAPHDDAEACMRQPLCFEVSLDSVGQRLQKWQPHLCPPPPLWLIWSCEFCRREGEARSPGWSNCSSSTRRSGLPSFALQGLLTQFMETSRPPTSTCTATPPPRLVQKHWSLSESHRGTCLRELSSLLDDNCYQNCQTFQHPTDLQLGTGVILHCQTLTFEYFGPVCGIYVPLPLNDAISVAKMFLFTRQRKRLLFPYHYHYITIKGQNHVLEGLSTGLFIISVIADYFTDFDTFLLFHHVVTWGLRYDLVFGVLDGQSICFIRRAPI